MHRVVYQNIYHSYLSTAKTKALKEEGRRRRRERTKKSRRRALRGIRKTKRQNFTKIGGRTRGKGEEEKTGRERYLRTDFRRRV